MTERVRTRLGLPVRVLKAGERPAEPNVGFALWLKVWRGRFHKPCPCTPGHRGCGLEIVHIGENCTVGCRYCILKAYFQDRVLKIWVNVEDCLDELSDTLGDDRPHRLCTGEFTDSLVFEPLSGWAAALAGFVKRFPRVTLELKSKIVDDSWLAADPDPAQILPSFSLNAPAVVASDEGLAASIGERLSAAARFTRLGFRVAFHFDPVLHYPGWEAGYAETIRLLGEAIDPALVAHVSLGSFRFMPALKGVIERESPTGLGPRWLYAEFVAGLDGKQRLLRPVRRAQLAVLRSMLTAWAPSVRLYYCMD